MWIGREKKPKEFCIKFSLLFQQDFSCIDYGNGPGTLLRSCLFRYKI